MSNIEVGKTYRIEHSRKGIFTGRLVIAGDTWATFEITTGKTKAMLADNAANKGEQVQIRISLATFSEV